jgi:hypothetical protein
MATSARALIGKLLAVLACVSLSTGIAWGQTSLPATIVIATGRDPSFAH